MTSEDAAVALHTSPPPAALEAELPQAELDRITDDLVDALKTVFDPEIPVNIYDLGLIYKAEINKDRHVDIEMTLTAPGCPVAGEMPGWVEAAARKVDGVASVTVNLVFDPPWSQANMSDEAKLQLGMFYD